MKPCSRSSASMMKKRRVEELEEDIMKPCQSGLRSPKKNFVDFLFAEEMGKDYLICGGGSSESRVGIDILRDKYVGILFSEPCGGKNCYRVLLQVYNEIRKKNGKVFELVYIAKMDDEEDEYQKLNLPFLAVPFGDLEWRKRLCNMYFSSDLYEQRHLLLFDPQGRRLKEHGFKVCESILEALTLVFGPAFYPFTAVREMQLIEEGEAQILCKYF